MLPIITSGMSSVWESTGNEAAGCGRGGRGGRGLGKKTAATFTTSWERIDKSGKNKTDTGSGGDLYDDPRSDRRHILPPLFYLISSVVLVRYRQSWPSFIFLLLSFFLIRWLFAGYLLVSLADGQESISSAPIDEWHFSPNNSSGSKHESTGQFSAITKRFPSSSGAEFQQSDQCHLKDLTAVSEHF